MKTACRRSLLATLLTSGLTLITITVVAQEPGLTQRPRAGTRGSRVGGKLSIGIGLTGLLTANLRLRGPAYSVSE